MGPAGDRPCCKMFRHECVLYLPGSTVFSKAPRALCTSIMLQDVSTGMPFRSLALVIALLNAAHEKDTVMNEDVLRGFTVSVASNANALTASRVRCRRTLLMRALAAFTSSALATATVAASIGSGNRFSQDDTGTQAEVTPLQERPKPPQAAFDACRNRAEGEACTVEFGGQEISGTCRRAPGGEQDLVCMPARPPGARG